MPIVGSAPQWYFMRRFVGFVNFAAGLRIGEKVENCAGCCLSDLIEDSSMRNLTRTPLGTAGVVAAAGVCLFFLAGASGGGLEPSSIPNFTGEWARPGRLFDFALPRDGMEPGPLVNTSGNRLVPVANFDSPILKPWAAEEVKKHGDRLASGFLAPDAHSSCRPMGVPYVLQVRGNVWFLQSENQIVIAYEDDNQRRLVRLNAKHSADPTPSPMGESVGHYEGSDTLVIDTIGIEVREVSSIDRFGTPNTYALHVVERYRIGVDEEGERALFVDIAVDDPNTFNMAWYASSIYGPGGMYEEDICAENIRWFGEDDMIPIPQGTDSDF
jgi:hypothetical protein